MLLECYVPCLIVCNRNQLFKIIVSKYLNAFKRPTKKLGMLGLFTLGLGRVTTVSSKL